MLTDQDCLRLPSFEFVTGESVEAEICRAPDQAEGPILELADGLYPEINLWSQVGQPVESLIWTGSDSVTTDYLRQGELDAALSWNFREVGRFGCLSRAWTERLSAAGSCRDEGPAQHTGVFVRQSAMVRRVRVRRQGRVATRISMPELGRPIIVTLLTMKWAKHPLVQARSIDDSAQSVANKLVPLRDVMLRRSIFAEVVLCRL